MWVKNSEAQWIKRKQRRISIWKYRSQAKNEQKDHQKRILQGCCCWITSWAVIQYLVLVIVVGVIIWFLLSPFYFWQEDYLPPWLNLWWMHASSGSGHPTLSYVCLHTGHTERHTNASSSDLKSYHPSLISLMTRVGAICIPIRALSWVYKFTAIQQCLFPSSLHCHQNWWNIEGPRKNKTGIVVEIHYDEFQESLSKGIHSPLRAPLGYFGTPDKTVKGSLISLLCFLGGLSSLFHCTMHESCPLKHLEAISQYNKETHTKWLHI